MVQAAKPLVVITGVSGYIGCHIASLFVKDGGFTVRGTVRNLEKPHILSNQIEIVKADLEDPPSLDSAIQGATYVVHTATPVLFDTTPEKVINPAVNGTISVLKAAQKHKVKRVVLTSTVAAASQYTEEVECTEECWGDVEKMREDEDLQPYYLGKVLAEKGAWEF